MEAVQIFEDIDKEIKIPTDKAIKTGNMDIISEGINEAITKDVVSAIIIPEEEIILQPNYVIDIDDIDEVENIQVEALDEILREDGDLAIYLYYKGGIQKIGMSDSNTLHKIIVPAITNIFDNRCKIYRNFKPGTKLNVVNTKDISHLRLRI